MAEDKKQIRVGIIMAGGSGQRFWPLSRCCKPKQLLPLTDPKLSMLEVAAQLVEPLIPPEQLFVVTSKDLVEPIRNAETGIPPENILGEPDRRNTAGCLSFVAVHLLQRFDAAPEDITMAVVTADHRIGKPEAYRSCLRAAIETAEREPSLGVIGMQPDRPETGYGYVEVPEGAEPASGSSAEHPVYPVSRFREKPNRDMAERLLATGRCYWNSGMFFWRLSTFLSELAEASPALFQAVQEMSEAAKAGDTERLESVFLGLGGQPIDIALLERSSNVVMTPGAFSWEDVGSWDALHRMLTADEDGNVSVGEPVLVDARDCLVYNQTGSDKTAVAVVGVEGLAVVVTDDGILVTPRERSQDVKRAVAELRKRGAKQL